MDLLQGYESEGNTVDEVGFQDYNEEIELDESVFKVLNDAEVVVDVLDDELARRSPSRSASGSAVPIVPDLDIDHIPPPRRGKLIPDIPPPKSWKILTIEELVAIIQRCGLDGRWA